MRSRARALFWPGAPGAPEPTRRLWTAIARRVVQSPVAGAAPFGLPLLPAGVERLRLAPSFELGSTSRRQRLGARLAALMRHFEPASVRRSSRRSRDATTALVRAVEGPTRSTGSEARGEPGVARVFSLTRPTGEPGRLGRATLASQLHELRRASGRDDGGRLAEGLGARGPGGRRARRAGAQARGAGGGAAVPLVGGCSPATSTRCTRSRDTAQDLERLEGDRRSGARRDQLADGVGRGAARLRALSATRRRRVLDHLALTPRICAARPASGARSPTT